MKKYFLKDVDRALKQFVFETMNLTEVSKRNLIRKNEQNVIIPWDDPYPNISEILSEEQQIFLKNLNVLEAKKGMTANETLLKSAKSYSEHFLKSKPT